MINHWRLAAFLFTVFVLAGPLFGQDAAPGPDRAAVELGSRTAKGGFRNEDEIAAKFNAWRTDAEAVVWLGFMGYRPGAISSVAAAKPHGEKADVVVQIRMLPQSRRDAKQEERREGISIKLVSSQSGFNQIDKRWLSHYAKMWRMPAEVVTALRLFVGEVRPNKPSRRPERMFLNELTPEQRKAVTDFFAANKTEIVADLFSGDGEFAAAWMMVALKSSAKPRWVLRRIDHVIKFFGEGPVEITRAGNLKIGRITMQRKGGDGGRETARMLQFKIDPSLLFDGQ